MFSFNCVQVNSWSEYFKGLFDEIGVKADFIDQKIEEDGKERDAYVEMLKKYFSDLKLVTLPTKWHYTDSKEIVDKMIKFYPDQEKLILAYEKKIRAVLDKAIKKDGEVVIETSSEFWHCGK